MMSLCHICDLHDSDKMQTFWKTTLYMLIVTEVSE